MSKHLFSFLLASSLMVPACATIPGLAEGTSSIHDQLSAISIGFSGDSYTARSVANAPGKPGAALTYHHILFQPTAIELHWTGNASGPDATATQDEAAVSEDEPTAKGTWISVPISNSRPIDLTAIGAADLVPMANGALKPGSYDTIRLTGSGTYEASDASGQKKTGDYFLPSGRLYINHGFEVREGSRTQLAFSFDVRKAMVTAGPKVILKPTSIKVSASYHPIEAPVASPSPEASPTPEASPSPETSPSSEPAPSASVSD